MWTRLSPDDDGAFHQASVFSEPFDVNTDTDEDSGDEEANQATTASVTIMQQGTRIRPGDPEQDDQLVKF